jgi:type II secretory pathway component GspD/PulD (secretin)
MKNWVIAVLLVGLICAGVYGAEPTVAKTVTLDVTNTPVADVLKQIAKATGETILVEKIVSGNVTVNIKDASAEKALSAVTKTLNIQWRKIYVPDGSVLASDADALAAQMRTVLSVKFPDILITDAGAGGSFVHVQRQTAANEFLKTIPTSAGFKKVYLVTDDEKAYKKEVKDESKQKVAKYVADNRALLETFLKMTPEERAEVMKESVNMASQMDPKLLADMMSSMAQMNPDFFVMQNRIATEALINMSPEARRNLIRMSVRSNLEMMKSLPPEVLQQMQEEAAAVAMEMMNEQPK